MKLKYNITLLLSGCAFLALSACTSTAPVIPVGGREGLIIIDRSIEQPIDNQILIPARSPKSGGVMRIDDKDCIIL